MPNSEDRKWWNSLDEIWQKQLISDLMVAKKFKDKARYSSKVLKMINETNIGLQSIINLKHVTVPKYSNYNLSQLAQLRNVKEIFIEPIDNKDNIDSILPTTPDHLRSKINRLYMYNIDLGDDLSIFEDFVNLTYLNCHNCNLKSLNGGEKLTKLKALHVEVNNISDLSPLRELKLIHLSIGNTQVQDISPLLDIPTIKFLSLLKLNIDDYAVLLLLPNLSFVYLLDWFAVYQHELEMFLTDKLLI